jgi:hypothetical protein
MASGASKESLLERLDKGVTNSEQERVTISSQNDTPKGLRKDPLSQHDRSHSHVQVGVKN